MREEGRGFNKWVSAFKLKCANCKIKCNSDPLLCDNLIVSCCIYTNASFPLTSSFTQMPPPSRVHTHTWYPAWWDLKCHLLRYWKLCMNSPQRADGWLSEGRDSGCSRWSPKWCCVARDVPARARVRESVCVKGRMSECGEIESFSTPVMLSKLCSLISTQKSHDRCYAKSSTIIPLVVLPINAGST